jgi:Xaa-Pro aminopeptidase
MAGSSQTPHRVGADHLARIDRFATTLGEADLAAALISQPQDLFYLAGSAQPANLLVVPGHEPVLFARRFAALTRTQTAVPDVREGAGFGAVIEELGRLGVNGGRLGLELDVIPATLYRSAQRAFAGFEIVDCAPLLLGQRAIKDPHEVALLRTAAAAYEAVHAAFVAHLAPGVMEVEIAAEVQRAVRLAGHAGVIAQRRWDAALAPEGAMASGPDAATPSGGPISITGHGLSPATPFGASRRRLAPGDLMTVDMGLNVAGYHADMARTYVVGEPSDAVRRYATIVRQLEDAIIAAVVPGVPAREVYEQGVAVARELGVGDIFQGHSGVHGPYVGHSIGLEIDEPPVLGPRDEAPVSVGMVLAIEPKLVSPAFGGVNLEDDIVVTAAGCEVLSTVPRSVFAVDGRGGVQALTP